VTRRGSGDSISLLGTICGWGYSSLTQYGQVRMSSTGSLQFHAHMAQMRGGAVRKISALNIGSRAMRREVT
jgi:hypothetical protein